MSSDQDDKTPNGCAVVRADLLRRFEDVVGELGGDGGALLARFQLDSSAIDNRHAVIPYRAFVQLLEQAAQDLGCRDFGMRLASAQAKVKTPFGPLEIAMRNARTLREAYSYCESHRQAVSSVAYIGVEEDRAEEAVLLRFDVFAPRASTRVQAAEHALLLTYHKLADLSGGKARAHEIWFAHEPVSPAEIYQRHFGGVTTLFGRRCNALRLLEREFDAEIPDRDPQIFELASDYIDRRFPASTPDLTTRVRGLIERGLSEGDCSFAAVAAMLSMHPRTLQRRLRAEGQSFETIKDAVRKDLALHYLTNSTLPLSRIADMLGYAETSVFSRSCYRWFEASPRELRAGRGVSDQGSRGERFSA